MLYNLGAVPYLNALPLIHFLGEKPTLGNVLGGALVTAGIMATIFIK